MNEWEQFEKELNESVLTASELIQKWIDEEVLYYHCIPWKQRLSPTQVYNTYQAWCYRNNHEPMLMKNFRHDMIEVKGWMKLYFLIRIKFYHKKLYDTVPLEKIPTNWSYAHLSLKSIPILRLCEYDKKIKALTT